MKAWSCIFLLSLISFLSAAEGYSLFEENGKFGLKNQHGQVMIPANYEAIGWSDGAFSVINRVTGYQSKGLWGLINLDNHRVTKAEFTELVSAESSLIVAHKKSGLRIVAGCLNTSGKEIIPFQYDDLKVSSLRVITVAKSGTEYTCGLLDIENKLLIPVAYRNIHSIGSLRYAVENYENKIALFTENGRQITGFTIDSISSFQKNFAVIYQNLKQGLIDREGQIKIEAKYREVKIQEDGFVNVRQANEWLLLDGQNQLHQKIQNDSVVSLGENLFKLEEAGQIQLVDQQLKPISTSSFSYLGKFKKGKAIFRQGNKTGLIRKDGQVLIEPKFDQLLMGEDFLMANQYSGGKDHWAVLDTLGNRKHSKSYERIEAFNGKFFPVKNHGYWGAVNSDGKEIIACVHDSLIQCLNENVVVKFRGQFGIINLQENWLVTPQLNPIHIIEDDRYLESTSNNVFLKSFDGDIIYFTNNKLETQPDCILEHLPSGAIWKIDYHGRIIDRQVQPDEPIEKVFSESEGLRAIQKDGKFGFIDNRGRLRIANRYDDVQHFSESLAAAKIRGHWGYINHEDKIAIQPSYEEVTPFQHGYAFVKQKGLYGMIDKMGKQILPIRYQALKILGNYRILLMQDGLYGLADKEGKILVNPKFNQLQDLNNDYLIVQRDGKFGLLTSQGVSTIPLMYDLLVYDAYTHQYIAMKKTDWEVLKL